MEKNNEKNQLKKVLKQHYSFVYFALFVGLCFVSVGIGVFASAWRALNNVSVIVVVSIVFILFSGMGVFWIVDASKRISHYVNSLFAYAKGKDAVATICDFRAISTRTGSQKFNDRPWRCNTWYLIKLKYIIDGEELFFKTAYMYNITQLEYLQSLSKIHIKYLGRKVVIIEKFPQDESLILQKFSDLPKNIRIAAIVIQCIVFFSLLLLIGGFFVSGFLKQNWLIFVGLGALCFSAILKGYFLYIIEKRYKK